MPCSVGFKSDGSEYEHLQCDRTDMCGKMGNKDEKHDGVLDPRCETKHNQHRRSYWHDYRQKGLYMITMAEEGTVLITPGISKGESLVASDALDAHLPLILVQ